MRIILIFLLVTSVFATNGQTTTKVRKVVTILPEQGIYLNSTSNGYFYGGKSRVSYKIDLPANTVEWYYIFSTSPYEGENQNLDLVSQLTRVMDPSGLLSVAINSLTTPPGTGGLVDIYIMGYENKKIFDEKDALGAWLYESPGGWQEGTSENAKQGKKKIDDVKTGTIYLGLKNPHSSEGVNVTIEVAAIVEEEVTNLSEWSIDVKESLFNTYKENLISNDLDEEIASEIATCFIDKLVSIYTPANFTNLSESEILTIENTLSQECITQLQGGEKTEEEEKGSTVGSMAWSAYENGDIEKAITYSKKALEYDNTLGWVHGNLGLFYLIKGEEMTSLEFYLDAIKFVRMDRLNAKETFKELAIDLENAKVKYPELQGHEEILEQLNQEISEY